MSGALSLRAVLGWMDGGPRHRTGVRAFEVAAGLFVLFRATTEIRFVPFLWGPGGISDVPGAPGAGLFASTAMVWFLFVLRAGAGLALVLGLRTRLAFLTLVATTLAFDLRLPELLDGGDNVFRLVAVYAVLLLPADEEAPAGSVRAWLHNVGVLAIAAQLSVLYLTSGFLKARGEVWHNGTALYLISQVEWFSHPTFRAAFQNPVLTTLSSYATVFYQVCFPVAMLSRLRLPWLVTGISFHAGILVTMGLVPFSTIMIGLELLLITDAEYARAGATARATVPRFGRPPPRGRSRGRQEVGARHG